MPNLALPGNPRYQPKALQPYFGYDNHFGYVALVEIAVLRTLGEIGIISPEDMACLTPEIEEKLLEITTTHVDEVERQITHHDIRAWVRLAQEILPAPLRRWVHIPLTSYDVLDTARTLQFVRAHQNVLSPLVDELIDHLASKAEKYADTHQIGRTHGQHALPITVGFWLATILNRLVVNARRMNEFAAALSGKISGAVGADNAQFGLGITARCRELSFEDRVLKKLGLRAAPISTQILPPENLAYYLFACSMFSAALAQLGRDCRHLMRTEISEIGEPFEVGQVGSSTMAHKRNPINFENVEGMWLRTKNQFGNVLDTLVSEHQRDLVGSSLARDYPIIVVNLVQQLNTLLRRKGVGPTFIERLSVDVEACHRNFSKQSKVILAEPLYIALQMAGYEGDAHEFVNHVAVPKAISLDQFLIDVVQYLATTNPELASALARIPEEVMSLLYHPEEYTGLAADKTHEIVYAARNFCRRRLLR